MLLIVIVLCCCICLIESYNANSLCSSSRSSSRRSSSRRSSSRSRSIRHALHATDTATITSKSSSSSSSSSSSTTTTSSITSASTTTSIIKLLESKIVKPLDINIDNNDDDDDDGSHLDRIVRSLESQYMAMPIQTSQFLNFAISGKWRLLHSSFPTPKADNTIIFDINQTIKPIDGIDGELNNVINWKLNREDDDAYGKLTVECSYKMTSKGGLEITLKDHILNVEKIPNNVQELLTTMQRTVPFEFFDPNEYTAITTVSYINHFIINYSNHLLILILLVC